MADITKKKSFSSYRKLDATLKCLSIKKNGDSQLIVDSTLDLIILELYKVKMSKNSSAFNLFQY